MERLLKALALIRGELGAAEALVEIGDERDPHGPEVLRPLEPGVRIVVRFESVVPMDSGERLDVLLEGMGDLRGHVRRAAPSGPVRPAQRELSEVLFRLAKRAGAERAVVLDTRSPIVFGDSHDPEGHLDVEDALHAARLARRVSDSPEDVIAALSGRRDDPLSDREWLQLEALTRPPEGLEVEGQVRLELAIADLRADPPEDDRRCRLDGPVPLLARRIAAIYWVLLVFEDRFSEVQADGHLVHALEPIERLVVSLPPLDPKGGAKAGRFRPV